MQLALLQFGALSALGICVMLILLGVGVAAYLFVSPRIRAFKPNLKKYW